MIPSDYITPIDEHEDPKKARSSNRHEVLKAANILSESEELYAVCIVRNVSKTGARALVDFPAKIPDTIILVLIRTQIRYNCKVVWRDEYEIGLKFIS